MTVLLDGNALVALCVVDHVHHGAVAAWFSATEEPFATSPTTQGTLLRFLIRGGLEPSQAATVLDGITRHPRHVYWPDDAPYDAATLRGLVGHRQVTDAYLAARARTAGGRVATLDHGFAAMHRAVAQDRKSTRLNSSHRL